MVRGDSRHPHRTLGRVDFLLLDDCGLEPFDTAVHHEFAETFDHRYDRFTS
ncbi:hypothetical protein AAFG07_32590 [Bradyrhizobium sp. B097]|uniref:hypothetical protein n=1 Tax=Bradyrhizobium sp. B097 TaxID=3140244 RepID=UPI0031841BE9